VSFEGWITPGTAARLLDVSTERCRQLAREGRLKALKTPLGMLLWEASVREYLASRSPRGKDRGGI
jgi:excisionase family DNA binding protein